MHTLQARECLQVHRVVTHGEIGSFRERYTQLSREIGVLEVRLVEGTGCQDDSERVFAFIAVTQELLAQLTEDSANAFDTELPDRLRQDLFDERAGRRGGARAGGRRRAGGRGPPAAGR